MNRFVTRCAAVFIALALLATFVPMAASADLGHDSVGAAVPIDSWFGVKTAGGDPIDCLVFPDSWPHHVTAADIIGGPGGSCYPSSRVALPTTASDPPRHALARHRALV